MTTVSAVHAANVRPFISCLVLKYTGTDLDRPVPLVKEFLKAVASRGRRNVTREIVADGLEGLTRGADARTPDDLDAFVYARSQPPPWLKADAGSYIDTDYELVVMLRWNQYVAIAGGAEFRDGIERWVRGPLCPPFDLVPDLVLEQALLAGEAKGLWLSGTHHRSKTKADTKNVTGMDLHATLSPIEDGSYALNSGRAALAGSTQRIALTGIVGTTPRRSVVWNRPARDFEDFVTALLELLELLEQTEVAGVSASALPQLAASVTTLSGVAGAYEVLVPTPDEILNHPGATDDQLRAAYELEGAVMDVVGSPTDPDFDLVVGKSGAEVGRVAVRVEGSGRSVRFDVRTRGTPSDPADFAAVRSALEELGHMTVYYQSGHVIRDRQTYLYQIPAAPFRNWLFGDFTGFDVAMEKPENASSEAAIHERCGGPRDRSLFGWVARNYASGHLICDDGSGEIADFLHLSIDETLSLIHVKAAHSTAL